MVPKFSSDLLKNHEERLKRGVEQQSHTNQVLAQHTKLAQLFNALYLDMELSDGNIDVEDLIVGIWNLKDKSVLDKLFSIDANGLSEQLDALNKSLAEFPNDMTQIANLEEIREKHKTFKEITNEMRDIVVEAIGYNRIPDFAYKNRDSKDNFRLLGVIDNLAEKVLESLATEYRFSVKLSIKKCQSTIESLEFFLPHLINDKKLSVMWKAMEIAKTMYENNEDLIKLSYLLSSTQALLIKLDHIENDVKQIKIKQDWNLTLDALHEIHQPSKSIPIGSAFIDNHNLSRIRADFQNGWMKSVLNRGNSLQQLKARFQKMNEFAEKSLFLENSLNVSLDMDNSKPIRYAFDLANEIDHFHTISNGVKSLNTRSIYILSYSWSPYPSNVVNTYSKDMKSLQEVSHKFQKILNETSNLDKIKKKLEYYGSLISKMDYVGFSIWKGTSEFKEAERFFTDLANGFFSSLIQREEFFETIANLNIDAVSRIGKFRQWASDQYVFREHAKAVYDFDFEPLEGINEIAEIITRIKSEGHIQKLQTFLKAIPKVKADLMSLKDSIDIITPIVNQNKSSKKLDVSRKSLLEVSYAVHSLERIQEIDSLDRDFEILFNSTNLVSEAIEKVKNPRRKKELEKIWNEDWPSLEKNLIMLRRNNTKAMKQVRFRNTTNLDQVGFVYHAISVVKFPDEQFQLRKYIESMRLLEPIQELEDAMRRLEKPISMNWGLVHTNFKKVPSALRGLQEDFRKFFEEPKVITVKEKQEDEQKPEEDDHMIYIYGYAGLMGFLSIGGSIAMCVTVFCVIHNREEPVPEKYYTRPDGIDFDPSYIQLQDSRLEINTRDPKTNRTQIYQAVLDKDWKTVDDLLEQGAILDATCGPKHRTALFELVMMREEEYCKKFLEKGADPTIHDVTGETSEGLAEKNGLKWIFDHYKKYRDEGKIRRTIPPNTPRPWKILVLDRKCVPNSLKRKLPMRIRRKTIWGYRPDRDLNSFTHIVLPKKYYRDNNSLILQDKDLLTYKLYGCGALLMNIQWLKDLANKKIGETALDTDFDSRWSIKDVGSNLDTVRKIKTRIHKMQPALLTGIRVYFPDKRFNLWDQDKEWKEIIQWKEIIELFGGQYFEDVVPDVDDCPLPYYITRPLDPELEKPEPGRSFPNCWVLKDAGSDIGPKWKNSSKYLLLEFNVFTGCLASSTIPDPIKEREKQRKEDEEELNEYYECEFFEVLEEEKKLKELFVNKPV